MSNPANAAEYHIVIPARYASERLPGKLLLDLAGRPVLQHVWQRARESAAKSVTIATDDQRIAEAAQAFGAPVVMTAADHQSGSDRIAECARHLGWPDDQLVVNLQGDEPLMPPACLDQVAELLNRSGDCDVASLYWPAADADEVQNPNAVKVVTDARNRAMYFSRSPIPYARAYRSIPDALAAGAGWKRHLGLYAYRLAALHRFTACTPTPLEISERLEQLRMLENGVHIAMAQACEFIPAGIDVAEDLQRVRDFIKSKISK